MGSIERGSPLIVVGVMGPGFRIAVKRGLTNSSLMDAAATGIDVRGITTEKAAFPSVALQRKGWAKRACQTPPSLACSV